MSSRSSLLCASNNSYATCSTIRPQRSGGQMQVAWEAHILRQHKSVHLAQAMVARLESWPGGREERVGRKPRRVSTIYAHSCDLITADVR